MGSPVQGWGGDDSTTISLVVVVNDWVISSLAQTTLRLIPPIGGLAPSKGFTNPIFNVIVIVMRQLQMFRMIMI